MRYLCVAYICFLSGQLPFGTPTVFSLVVLPQSLHFLSGCFVSVIMVCRKSLGVILSPTKKVNSVCYLINFSWKAVLCAILNWSISSFFSRDSMLLSPPDFDWLIKSLNLRKSLIVFAGVLSELIRYLGLNSDRLMVLWFTIVINAPIWYDPIRSKRRLIRYCTT